MTPNTPIQDLWKYDLRQGKTDHPRNGACLFDAGMWLVYGRIGDNPPCSCPVIRAYATGLNDRMDDAARQLLKPFILRVVGNRDPAAEPARRMHIVAETARRVVPLAFGPALAAEMRALPDDYGAIRRLMLRARAYARAKAARDATNAASAVYSAAWAGDTAAAADHVAAWPEAISILDGALRIGKQSPEFDPADIRAAVAAFELART
jgi:hypothetical protein